MNQVYNIIWAFSINLLYIYMVTTTSLFITCSTSYTDKKVFCKNSTDYNGTNILVGKMAHFHYWGLGLEIWVGVLDFILKDWDLRQFNTSVPFSLTFLFGPILPKIDNKRVVFDTTSKHWEVDAELHHCRNTSD